MTISARVVADSVSPAGARIATLELKLHGYILPEFSRHRAFSLSVSSARAIPLERAIRRVEEDPAVPLFWGRNRAGMQSTEELSAGEIGFVRKGWFDARDAAVLVAHRYRRAGLHKQVAARVLSPYSWSHVVVTSTDYANFFALRMHRDAQPEIQALAVAMARALRDSVPVDRPVGGWHLPYVTDAERDAIGPEWLVKASAARAARVSYRTHDGREPVLAEDLELFDRLMGGDPKHSSPSEHQAFAAASAATRSGNFVGWFQHRQTIAGHVAPPDFDWRGRLAEYDAAGRDYIV